jgi:hypothetical protein
VLLRNEDVDDEMLIPSIGVRSSFLSKVLESPIHCGSKTLPQGTIGNYPPLPAIADPYRPVPGAPAVFKRLTCIKAARRDSLNLQGRVEVITVTARIFLSLSVRLDGSLLFSLHDPAVNAHNIKGASWMHCCCPGSNSRG